MCRTIHHSHSITKTHLHFHCVGSSHHPPAARMVQEKDGLVRKRVLYIGSAVPTDTADGLDGVQKPLSERYPTDDDSNIEGILSFISVVPTGLTLQYVSDPGHVLFFPFSSLTLCAAVRCVRVTHPTTGEQSSRFVSLNSPAAGGAAGAKRPAIFTTITRRTEGRKVLECHGFVCASSKDALELVQWTSHADKLCKGKLNGGMAPPGASFRPELTTLPRGPAAGTFRSAAVPSSGFGVSAAADGTDDDHPVRLVVGDRPAPEAAAAPPQQKVAPEFYEPAPEHGYFYKTKDSQIKTYSVERVMEGEAERLRAFSPSAGAPTITRGERRPPGVGAGGGTLPPPQGRPFVPMRTMHPIIRPRFFSPPPPMMRSRPLAGPPPPLMARDPYVFLPPPPPPHPLDASFGPRRRPTHRRGGSDTSSGSGSSRSSSPDSRREMNGRRAVNGDGSSDVSSRPRTPPTDYERSPPPRVSRKEQFDQSRRRGRPEYVGSSYNPPGGHPYDLYVYPARYPPYPGYPPYMLDRARSVPPPADRRGKSSDRKKSRKGKKEKKKKSSSKLVYGVASDISTDSVGYTSEAGLAGAGDGEQLRMPRDFRRFENQFRHERAFSKSLREEFRGGPGDMGGNAYSLNERMVKRGSGAEPDFSMY